jgi:carboxypeptidase A4
VALSPSNSEIVTAGNSLNGNAITGIHFWGSSGKGVKPAIVFHGTVHAREWISTMVVEYMAYNLLTNYAKSSEIKGFIDKYDFYLFPVVNPDGEIHSHNLPNGARLTLPRLLVYPIQQPIVAQEPTKHFRQLMHRS